MLKFFVSAEVLYVKEFIFYILSKGGWLKLLGAVTLALDFLLVIIDGPHEKHVDELLECFQFVLWWIALGVASSVGLGSGLHFRPLFGPSYCTLHIKAMHCGRVDLKSASYDTMQLKRGPSWLDKDCSEFGPPVFQSIPGLRVPLSSILPQIQLEAVLWGVGTAIGELPPYFISKAVYSLSQFATNSFSIGLRMK